MPLISPRRTAGLDTLRACAIALVFMYHYMVFVSHTPTFGWASTVGWAGVDLFFVLSGYMTHIYYASWCRVDEFLPGVAVALLRHGHPPLWERLMHHGGTVLLVGVPGSAAMLYGALDFYYIDGYGYGYFMTAFGYTLLAASFALLVIAALSPRTFLHGARIPGAAQLALWSYSIYLIHKPVGNIVSKLAVQWEAPAQVTLVATIGLSLGLGALLYALVERPFMRLRDRLAPVNLAPRTEDADACLRAPTVTGNTERQIIPLHR